MGLCINNSKIKKIIDVSLYTKDIQKKKEKTINKREKKLLDSSLKAKRSKSYFSFCLVTKMSKRKFFKRNSVPKRFNKMMTLTKKVNKMARNLKPEMKSRTISFSSGTVSNTGSVQQLDLIPAGSDATDRTGISVRVKGIGFHATIFAASTVIDINKLRVIVFVDKQQEKDAKSDIATVLQETNPLSYINQVRRPRFRILYDNLIVLDLTNKFSRKIIWWKKLDFIQTYNGPAGTDMEKNNIFLLLLSNEPTNKPTFQFTSRIIYTDV